MSNSGLLKSLLELTKACVNREIIEANIYLSLLFKLANGLGAVNGFKQQFGGLFSYLCDSLETKYILALAKLFAPSSEAGLWRLIQQARNVTQESIDLKLERQSFAGERLKLARKEFILHFSEYENKILALNKKISPYRNIQRAHNIPWWETNNDAKWNEAKEWLSFAEMVFVQAMDGICEGCCRVGNFYPHELNGEIECFLQLIREVLENRRMKRTNLLTGNSPAV